MCVKEPALVSDLQDIKPRIADFISYVGQRFGWGGVRSIVWVNQREGGLTQYCQLKRTNKLETFVEKSSAQWEEVW